MTREEKQLLLRDLCARLPYGVKCKYYDVCEGEYDSGIIIGLDSDHYIHVNGICIYVEEIKLYLFPLSSMTEEQKEIYCQLQQKVIYNSKGFVTEDVMNYINWCYENHLDVNDLIPKGLAIDATGKNIYQ